MEMYVDEIVDQNGQPKITGKDVTFTDEDGNAPIWGGKYETLRVDM
jgi:hypothetical protein